MTKITAPSGCNVYVATLPLDFTDQQLAELFSPFGAISSARVMRSKGTRQSKGYGFVMFKDPRAAELAVVNLHGTCVGTTSIQVRVAHPGASKAVRSGQANRQGQEAAPSDSASSHTEDRTDSATVSDVASASLASQAMLPQGQPMLYSMPQTMAPMMMPQMPQMPTMYPTMAMPQPAVMQDTFTLMPTVSQQTPMYLVILPDGRQAVVCGY